MERVAVALSGGVDSLAAAILLKRSGESGRLTVSRTRSVVFATGRRVAGGCVHEELGRER